MTQLPQLKVPGAETSLRLAFYLLENSLADSVEVAIDGAQVKTLEEVHFAAEAFLMEGQGVLEAATEWRGIYRHGPSGGTVRIHSTSGRVDVIAMLRNGRTKRAESKKGPLVASASSREYPLIPEALEQLLTLDEVGNEDRLAVAFHTPPSLQSSLIARRRWFNAPVQLLIVTRDNQVHGLELQ